MVCARRSVRRLLVLAALPLSPLLAQREAPPTPPAAPPGPISTDARDAGFAEWLAAQPAQIGDPIIERATSARYEVIVESPRQRGSSRVATARARGIASCGQALGTQPQPLAALTGTTSWVDFDAAAGDAPLITLTIAPRIDAPSRCLEPVDAPLARVAMIASGLQAALDTLLPPPNDIRAAELVVGDRIVEPALAGRVPTVRLAPRGYVGPDGGHVLRLYVSADALVADGRERRWALRVWNATRTEPEIVAIPPAVIQQLWRELLPWRVERLRTATASGLPVGIPAPRDAVLARAHEAYVAGRFVEAAQAAVPRIDAPDVSREDRLSARMQLAATFSGHDDSAAAVEMFSAALSLEPCLTLPSSTPARMREQLERARPDFRCQPTPVLQVVRLGLIPGRAHRRLEPQRRIAGLTPALLTGAVAVGSVLLHLDARQQYQTYLDTRDDAARAYESAANAHATANAVGIAAWAVWGGTILHAVWLERRRYRQYDAVRDYGRDAARPLRIDGAAQGLGLAIYLF